MFSYNWSNILLGFDLPWLLILPAFLFLLLILRSRVVFSLKRATAKIINITPFFKDERQNKTGFLLCKYSYRHGEEIYNSQCLLTIKTFFPKQKGLVNLSWDKTLSLPVLKYKQLHLAGDQAIEHYLLQFKKDIKVSFEKAKPESSFPDELQARRVPQSSKKFKIPSAPVKKNLLTSLYPVLLLLFFFSSTRTQFAQQSANINRAGALSVGTGIAQNERVQNARNNPLAKSLPHRSLIAEQEKLGLGKVEKKNLPYPKEYHQALELYLKADFQGSLEKIRSIFEEYKDRMGLRMLAAANYIALDRPSQAMSHVQAAKRIYPRHFELDMFYVRILRAQKKYYEAIAQARKVIQETGESPGLALEIAAVYYELKSYPKARVQLQRVLELDSQNYYAFYLDGLLFLQEGRYELAEFRLRNALALRPKHKEDLKLLYNNLALALEKKGEGLEKRAKVSEAKQSYREAKAYYAYALAIEPENQLIRSNKERVDRR